MRVARPLAVTISLVLGACATQQSSKHTLAELRNVKPELSEVRVEDGLDKAMESYRRYLTDTPKSAMTPEAMRRLADLKVEKQFGLLGDGKLVEMAAPETKSDAKSDAKPEHVAVSPISKPDDSRPRAASIADLSESQREFERRATAQEKIGGGSEKLAISASGGSFEPSATAPLEAIALYDKLLAEYPNYEHADKVLYQKSRAFDELGRTEEAMQTMDSLIAKYPQSRYLDEVQFRRAEFFFTRRKYRDAETAYGAIIAVGSRSEYYELALYKLGWTLYKQEFYDEALHQFVALLDYKVSIGYDFDAAHEEADERRIADTFRIISLSFSNLGGPDIVSEYFAANGKRAYEDRIYSNLGEYYVDKLRYHDAAAAYRTFVKLNPYHRTAPHFSMRIVEIYTKGGFQKLVLDSKKEFAKTYGLQADYWRRFSVEERPEVVAYLKSNLKDLANHYHAQYQREDLVNEKQENYREALTWYRESLSSFPNGDESPSVNYQLADLLLEQKEFVQAAAEYERTAYNYAAHDKAAAAGYAAIFAYREHLKALTGKQVEQPRDRQYDETKRLAIASSLKFADTFPQDAHAAPVLGAAADDLYETKEAAPARAAAQKLIDRYPNAELAVRRSAWIVVAHASFDLNEYREAEAGYGRVLELVPQSDSKRAGFVDNLAASIYKQGEQASSSQDDRAAAEHYLRIKKVAPTAQKIAAAAQYDAAAAFIRLKDWTAAADVLEAFRRDYPSHELVREVTKQIANVYKEGGKVSQAASEYERVANESENPELRSEALLLAGDLHQKAKNAAQALAVYQRYVAEFPRPIEPLVETRFKIAELYKGSNDIERYRDQLQQIVTIDAKAGKERTDRTRNLAARGALVLAVRLYDEFAQVKLVQPFEKSLKLKQQRMDAALKSFTALIDYKVGEVTAGATFHMAELYFGFNRALMESERPANMKAKDLQKYELDLEENAFPYEERAIAVHEKNIELLRSGVYNTWTEKSLAKLATLMPVRYAKEEISSGPLGSIDRYAYRAPAASAAAPVAESASSGEVNPPHESGALAATGVPNASVP